MDPRQKPKEALKLIEAANAEFQDELCWSGAYDAECELPPPHYPDKNLDDAEPE